ncbi:MAG: hypothetical protein KGI03_02435, partial [Patescibacteria group bacterium]|nr:hypothetical protein [Patescibacteria group bacterium]
MGVILRGISSGTTGQLRIVPNGGAWADSQETTYFQITNSSNNNASFQGGTYGADTQLNRLQFNASSTQVTDYAFGSTPVPNSVFGVVSSSTVKTLFAVKNTGGSPSGDYLQISSSAGAGDLLKVTGAGLVGLGTTSPSTTLSVGGSGYITGGLGVGVLNTAAGTLTTSGNATIGGTLAAGAATTTDLAITHLANALLAANAAGSVVATTSIGANLLTGSLGSINGSTFNAGASITITAASSTLLANNNTWSGINTFTNASSNFAGTWQGYSPSAFATFSYPFPANATTTLLSLSGGFTAYASSTIGKGGVNGLTVNGNATTTGTAYFGGNVGIASTSPEYPLSVGNIIGIDASGNIHFATTTEISYPVSPGNSALDIVAQNDTYHDNLISLENDSILASNGQCGNDALRFRDSVGHVERGAIGYSSVKTGCTAGYNPDYLYAEIGNINSADPDDTSFAIINTHGPGALNLPGTSYKVLDVQGSTGNLSLNDTSGNSHFYLNASNGHIGIGTTTPDEALVVNDTIQAGNTTQNGNLYFGGSTIALKSAYSSNILAIYTAGKEAARFDGNGRFAVGTSSPFAQLAASSTSVYPTFIADQHGSAPVALFLGGNVGIGTASPNTKLEVDGNVIFNPNAIGGGGPNTNSVNLIGNTNTTAFRATYNSVGALFLGHNSSNAVIGTDGTDLAFRTNIASGDLTSGSELMRITASGNVGIGTTSPSSMLTVGTEGTTQAISISGNAASLYTGRPTIDTAQLKLGSVTSSQGGGIEFQVSSANNGYGWKIAAPNVTSGNSNQSLLFLDRSNSATWSEKMRIDENGNVGIGTTSPGYPLDVKASGAIAARLYGNAGASSDNVQVRFAGQKDGELWALGSDVTGGGSTGDFEFYNLGNAGGSMGTKLTILGSGNVGIGTTSP